MTTAQPAPGVHAAAVLRDLLRTVGDQPPLTDEERASLRALVRRRLRRGI